MCIRDRDGATRIRWTSMTLVRKIGDGANITYKKYIFTYFHKKWWTSFASNGSLNVLGILLLGCFLLDSSCMVGCNQTGPSIPSSRPHNDTGHSQNQTQSDKTLWGSLMALLLSIERRNIRKLLTLWWPDQSWHGLSPFLVPSTFTVCLQMGNYSGYG